MTLCHANRGGTTNHFRNDIGYWGSLMFSTFVGQVRRQQNRRHQCLCDSVMSIQFSRKCDRKTMRKPPSANGIWNNGSTMCCSSFSPHFCVGFLFLVVHSCLPPPVASLTYPQLNHTHNLLTQLAHRQLVHTQFVHTQLSHTHTTFSHTTCPHTHNLLTHTHNFLTHTQLSHTQLAQTQLAHTQLVHTQLSLTHNLLTHNLLTHTTYSHSTCSHTHSLLTHSFLTHSLFTHSLFTHNLLSHSLSIHNLLSPRLFLWQAWHLATSTCILHGRRGTYGTGLALVAGLDPLVAAAVGWRHRPSLCVSGVAFMALVWLWWLLSHTHTPLCHTQLSHSFVAHVFHTQLCHTKLFHTTLSQILFTHSFVTQPFHTQLCHTHTTLSHTTLSHATLSHKTLSHTALSHTSLSRTQSFTRNFVTYDSFADSTFTYTNLHTHTTLSHTQLFHPTCLAPSPFLPAFLVFKVASAWIPKMSGDQLPILWTQNRFRNYICDILRFRNYGSESQKLSTDSETIALQKLSRFRNYLHRFRNYDSETIAIQQLSRLRNYHGSEAIAIQKLSSFRNYD